MTIQSEPTTTFFAPTSWQGKYFSAGWKNGEPTDVIEPATGAIIGSYGSAGASDLDAVVAKAVQAQKVWAAMVYPEKAAIFRRIGDLLGEHSDVLVDWLMREGGSGQGKAQFEAGLVRDEYYNAASMVAAPYGQLLRSGRPRFSFSRRVPAGVVGVIAPFNFPQILASRSVAPALAAGNAVILKPDPRTAVSGALFLAAILEEAGLPEGLFHALPGNAELGAALVAHRDVRIISFTGSTGAGRKVGAAAAEHLKRVHLELGGNNAMIVLPDADVARAASAGAWGSFLHQGQICMTTGRHLVHSSIYDEYVELLTQKALNIPVGNPLDGLPLGPIIDARQRDSIHGLVTASVNAGARLTAGGTYDGLFYQPTVLADSSPDHPGFADEIFGPVAPVLRFDTVDEAIEIVRRSEYGLKLGILTNDFLAGLAIADQIPVGGVHINDQTVDDEVTIPFGGMGSSGTGARFGGVEGNLEAFSETQWITAEREIPLYPF
jgi:benzaldehyde dehydrogenase (NAD)